MARRRYQADILHEVGIRGYHHQLKDIVVEISELCKQHDVPVSVLASYAEVSASAAHNLLRRKTRWPRFSTVWKLAKACGIEWKLTRKVRGIKLHAVG